MTGNTNKWRKPLALVASVATLATMGLVAGTANAATAAPYEVAFSVNDHVTTHVNVTPGESLADALGGYWTPSAALTGVSFDKFAGWTLNDAQYDFDAPVENNLTLKADTSVDGKDLIKVEFTGVSSTDFFFPDGTVDGATPYYYVQAGEKLGDQRVPQDKADNKVVTKWNIDDGSPTQQSGVVDLADFTVTTPANGSNVLKISPAETLTGAAEGVYQVAVEGDVNGYPTGAKSDGEPSTNADAGTTYRVDVAKGDPVTLPATWASSTTPRKKPSGLKFGNKTYSLGEKIDSVDGYMRLKPTSDKVAQFVVKFKDTDGDVIGTYTIDQDYVEAGTAYGFLNDDQRADISKLSEKNWTIKGWKLASGTVEDSDGNAFPADYTDPKDGTTTFHLFTNADFDHAAISQDAVFEAVTGGTTGTIKVTFEDTHYVGANKSVTVEGKGGEYLASDKFPTWTRDGYVFAGWQTTYTQGGSTKTASFDANTLLGVFPFSRNFTVTPVWEKADGSVLAAALAYIKPTDRAAQYFTSETWSNFSSVYDSVKNEKEKLEYPATDNKVSDTDAARLVSELKASWEQLKIDAKGNPGLNANGSNASTQNEFVYRLHKGGLRLYSQTPVEIYAAQRTGWTLDNGYLFRAAPKAAASDKYFTKYESFDTAAKEAAKNGTSASDLAGKLDAVADPIIKTIQRYSSPNGTDWVYVASTGTAEINSLKRGGWNYEGTAFVVPTFGGTPVVRFALNGQHLMSTGVTEQAALQRAGWTREGVAFRGL